MSTQIPAQPPHPPGYQPPQHPPERPPGNRKLLITLIAVGILILCGAVGGAVGLMVTNSHSGKPASTPAAPAHSATTAPGTATPAAPPLATSILKADGYGTNMSDNSVTDTLKADATSQAFGYNASKTREEFVTVYTAAGVASQGGRDSILAIDREVYPGATATMTGTIEKVAGPVSVMDNPGGTSPTTSPPATAPPATAPTTAPPAHHLTWSVSKIENSLVGDVTNNGMTCTAAKVVGTPSDNGTTETGQANMTFSNGQVWRVDFTIKDSTGDLKYSSDYQIS